MQTTNNIHALIWDDGLNTTSKLRITIGIGKPAVMAFITRLGYRKVCTRQVLKMLTIKHTHNSPTRKTSVQKFSSTVRKTLMLLCQE